jgi:hypothetical protein
MGTKEWDEHWAEVLAQRLGQEKADKAQEAHKAREAHRAEEPEAPAPPAADLASPGSAPAAPPPEDVVPRPASGPRGHYAATDGVGTPQPLDSLGAEYGGITTGWKVPASGALPVQAPAAAPIPCPADAPARPAGTMPAAGLRRPSRNTNVTLVVRNPAHQPHPSGAMPAAGLRGPRRSTSATLVVRKLTDQLSARDQTRALDILRGKADSGANGAGLAAIVVLSAVAAFAGTYLWTVVVRETGVLRSAESEFGAPGEAEGYPEHGPKVAAHLPEAATDAAAAAGPPAGEPEPVAETGPVTAAGPEPPADQASAGEFAAEMSSETTPLDQAAQEVGPGVDDTPPPAPGPHVRSFRAVAEPQAEEWVDLGGPIFSPAPAGAASREGDADGRER